MCTFYFRTEEVYCTFGRNSAPVAPGKGDAIGHADQDNHEDGHDGEDQDGGQELLGKVQQEV